MSFLSLDKKGHDDFRHYEIKITNTSISQTAQFTLVIINKIIRHFWKGMRIVVDTAVHI